MLTDAPDQQAQAAIDDGLTQYNLAKAGYIDARPLAVLVSDPQTGDVVGGLLGRTSLGLLFIDVFFIPPSLRGQGVGSAVMQEAEQEAIRRGCSSATLFTIWFQAADFYARHGYREVGRIECDPPGHTRVCMAKRLANINGPIQ
ncbi:MAG: GNAT family N-acetyltransferase [Pseudomonadota bacterium]|nr:GNAT family N-acetyltransferase [Pseudomonadota bacterium]